MKLTIKDQHGAVKHVINKAAGLPRIGEGVSWLDDPVNYVVVERVTDWMKGETEVVVTSV